MKARQTLSEKIEKYLRDEFNETEKKEFEEKLKQDPSLNQEIENYKTLIQGISRYALKQHIGKCFKKYKITRLALKAAIIILATGAIVFGTIAINKKYREQKHRPTETYELPAMNENGETQWADADRNLPTQLFYLDASQDTVIETKKGIVVAIPANCFVDENGQGYSGEIQLELKEAIDAASILKAGLSTRSGEELLQTGGMFYINARNGDKSLKIAPGKNIAVQVPTEKPMPGMQLFAGKRMSDGSINWVNPKPLERFLIPVNINTLNFYPPHYEDTLNAMGYDVQNRKFKDSLYFSFSFSNISPPVSSRQDSITADSIMKVLEKEIGTTAQSSVSDTSHKVQIPANPDGGKIFRQNCAVCHSLTDARITGPGLKGILGRVPSREWLFNYIKNNEKVKKSGDSYAQKLSKTDGGVMTIFEGTLSDAEINAVGHFIIHPKEGKRINPAKVKAIWNNKFQNTLLSTKEFEERMKYIHESCNEELLDLYVNNFDKNMWEIDSMAFQLTYDPRFREFASRREGKVKNSDPNVKFLRDYYAKKARAFAEAIEKTQRKFWDGQNTLTNKAYDKQNEEITRLHHNMEEEYTLNLKEARRQLGLPEKQVFPIGPADSYNTNITSLGWKNIDAYVRESTLDRLTLNYTDPNTGKKAIIRYEELKVTITNKEKYERVYCYLIPDKLSTFLRMKSEGNQFTEKLNELIRYELVCVAYKGDHVFYSSSSAVKSGVLTCNLKPTTESELTAFLKTNASMPGEITNDLNYMNFLLKEEKRQKKVNDLLVLKEKIYPVIFPCGNPPAESLQEKIQGLK